MSTLRVTGADHGGPFVHLDDRPKAEWIARARSAEPCGPWRLSPAELEALDWAVELDARSVRPFVRQDVVEAIEQGDREQAAALLGARFGAQAQADATHAATVGLVSVPTSRKRTSKAPKPARLDAERTALAEALDSFKIDAEARRLASLRRSVGFAARASCTSKHAAPADECLMVTLTYAGTNSDWSPKDIATFMGHVRKWYARKGLACRYVWVAELQKRGVIHYHVALWAPAGLRLPKPDEQGWWPHGMTRIEVARAAVPYLLKYLSKDTSKTFGSFPRGARIYGVGGLDHASRRARRWLGLPAFVQANSSMYDDWQRAPRVGLRRGGWLSPSGEHYPSEFARVQVGGVWMLKRVARHRISGAIDAAGPFAWLTDKPKAREVWESVAHAQAGRAVQ